MEETQESTGGTQAGQEDTWRDQSKRGQWEFHCGSNTVGAPGHLSRGVS